MPQDFKACERERCPYCGQTVSKRRINLYLGLIIALKRVWWWCQTHGTHEFSRKDIKPFLRNENDTARFGDLVYFGGLLYKKGKGKYGLNMERCQAFFQDKYPIPTVVIKDPITKMVEPRDYRTMSTIPNLMHLMSKEGQYLVGYEPRTNEPNLNHPTQAGALEPVGQAEPLGLHEDLQPVEAGDLDGSKNPET